MSANHFFFDDQTRYGRMLRSALNKWEQGDDEIRDVRACMIQMRSGDGSQDADYAEVTRQFKFETDAEAHAAFLKIDDAYFKIFTDAQVSEVMSSRVNLYDELR